MPAGPPWREMAGGCSRAAPFCCGGAAVPAPGGGAPRPACSMSRNPNPRPPAGVYAPSVEDDAACAGAVRFRSARRAEAGRVVHMPSCSEDAECGSLGVRLAKPSIETQKRPRSRTRKEPCRHAGKTPEPGSYCGPPRRSWALTLTHGAAKRNRLRGTAASPPGCHRSRGGPGARSEVRTRHTEFTTPSPPAMAIMADPPDAPAPLPAPRDWSA